MIYGALACRRRGKQVRYLLRVVRLHADEYFLSS